MGKKALTPKRRAEIAAAKINQQNKGKVFRLVKICDRPLTYKEVEITE